MEPGSLTMAARSCVPSLPSLNRTRSRKPPSRSSRVTLVSIEACNLFRLFARASPTPIITQLIPVRYRPFLDRMGRHFLHAPSITSPDSIETFASCSP
jgi:hypothetical protein